MTFSILKAGRAVLCEPVCKLSCNLDSYGLCPQLLFTCKVSLNCSDFSGSLLAYYRGCKALSDRKNAVVHWYIMSILVCKHTCCGVH